MFQGGTNIKKSYVGGTEIVKAYKGDKPSIWPVDIDVTTIYFSKDGENPSLTIEFDHHGTNATTTKPHFYYRVGELFDCSAYNVCFDSEDWIEVTGNSITVTATIPYDIHECVKHALQICGKGNTTIGRNINDYTTIKISENDVRVAFYQVHLDKLLDYDNPPTVLPDYCFYNLFNLDSQRLYSYSGLVVKTDANTAGHYTFGNFMAKIDEEAIAIFLSNMTNRQPTTFYNWITDTYVPVGDIYCPSSLYLEANSDSGVPNGWIRNNI